MFTRSPWRSWRGLLVASFITIGIIGMSSRPSRADEAPPSGERNVSYGFVVDGLAEFPEFVVIAYPWSLSNGAPTRELTEVKDGTRVRVGRRSGQPVLYALRRASFERWTATRTPASEDHEDPAADALVAGPGVVRCDVSLNVRHRVSARSSASSIEDRYRASAIDDATCTIELVKKDSEPRASAARWFGGCAIAGRGGE
jgi:hypothetical protein